MESTWNRTFVRQTQNANKVSGVIAKDGTVVFRDKEVPVVQFAMEMRANSK